MRARAKEYFPTVLLTLLSIVQALALELLWSHLGEADYIYELSWLGLLAWLQIMATFVGLVLIWVLYSSNVMRLRWVPTTLDLAFPFLIGVLEFLLVETLGPGELGIWFILMSAIFGFMNWDAHITMRRARQDLDNEVFFRDVKPARLRDFRIPIATVIGLLLVGVYLSMSSDTGLVAMLALLVVLALLGFQFRQAAMFWERSVAED